MSDRTIRAAGGVVWRKAGQLKSGEPEIEVAVIHRPRYSDWSIPKGKLAPGESEVEGALREVFEETGFRVHLGRPLGEVRYMKTSGGSTRPKVVRYWAMEADGGAFTPNREVDELKWLSLAEAQELLTHDHDRELLERFARGPVAGGCVLLVRHSRAGEAEKWQGDDRQRPLDEIGWQQSESLVRLLSRFPVEEIVSADFLRCQQSVEPFAEAVGIPIHFEQVFSELDFPGREDEAVKLMRTYGETGDATVVCSQGDVIPELLRRLAEEDHIDLPKDFQYKKGSVWALSFDGDRLLSAEYFPPPLTATPAAPTNQS